MSYHGDDYDRIYLRSGRPVETYSANTVVIGFVLLYFFYQSIRHVAVFPRQRQLLNKLLYPLKARVSSYYGNRFKLSTGNAQSQGERHKGDMARRVFGSTGGMASLLKAPSEALMSWAGGSPQQRSEAPPGLGNWDNSCYQNSVLQALSALDSLKPFLEATLGSTTDPREADTTGRSLLQTVDRLNDTENNGKLLWTPSKLKSMSSWQQQDAQEYYSKIIDNMSEEAAKAVISAQIRQQGLGIVSQLSNEDQGRVDQPSQLALQNPVEGLLAQRVACTRCGHSDGLSLIPFNCLTLPLSAAPESSIEHCLTEYTKTEEISDVECTKCTLLQWEKQLEQMTQIPEEVEQTSPTADNEVKVLALPPELRAQTIDRLQAIKTAIIESDYTDKTVNDVCRIPKKGRVSSTKTRQAVIGRAPQNLVVHVNRSVYDEMSGIQRKNYAHVKYPLTLDLQPWMLNQGSPSDRDTTSRRQPRSLLPDEIDATSACSYHLKAVIAHFGEHENGHYVCFRRHKGPVAASVDADERETKVSEEPQWWRLSDEEVSHASEDSVLGQVGAYMLFYERDPKDETPPMPEMPTVTDQQPVIQQAAIAETEVLPQKPHLSVESTNENLFEAGERMVQKAISETELRKRKSSTTATRPNATSSKPSPSHSSTYDQDLHDTVLRATRLRQLSRDSMNDCSTGRLGDSSSFRPTAVT